MLMSVRRGLQRADPLSTFNICRFLRRAVEGEARGGAGSKNVRLEILKFEGLLELLVQTATGDEESRSIHTPPRVQTGVSNSNTGQRSVAETLSILSPRSVLDADVDTVGVDKIVGDRLGTASSRGRAIGANGHGGDALGRSGGGRSSRQRQRQHCPSCRDRVPDKVF